MQIILQVHPEIKLTVVLPFDRNNMSGKWSKAVVKKIHDGSKNFKGVYPYPVAISVGYVEHSEHPELAFDDLVKIADARMYEDKEKFYKKYPKYGRK